MYLRKLISYLFRSGEAYWPPLNVFWDIDKCSPQSIVPRQPVFLELAEPELCWLGRTWLSVRWDFKPHWAVRIAPILRYQEKRPLSANRDENAEQTPAWEDRAGRLVLDKWHHRQPTHDLAGALGNTADLRNLWEAPLLHYQLFKGWVFANNCLRGKGLSIGAQVVVMIWLTKWRYEITEVSSRKLVTLKLKLNNTWPLWQVTGVHQGLFWGPF